MKKFKKISMLFLMLVTLVATTIPVSAATCTQDGVQITLKTDKQKYASNEKITAVITAQNMNDCEVKNVSLECVVPSGYQVEDDASLSISSLSRNGGTATLTVVLVPKTVGAPATGDSNNVLFWSVLVILAIVLLAGVCVLHRKKNGKLLSLFLCAAMVISLIPVSALEVKAADATRTAKVSETVEVGSKELVIEGKVTYTISGNDVVADNSGAGSGDVTGDGGSTGNTGNTGNAGDSGNTGDIEDSGNT
ncbi:MAG: hypothetical protein J6C37_05375, partial [Roseburia sp.]|nr:hypothetical protein [Roseburia sp.]